MNFNDGVMPGAIYRSQQPLSAIFVSMKAADQRREA
jgi:hypothetical protein